MRGDTEPGTCTSVRTSALGNRRHNDSSTFSPPRMPVSQSCTSTTRRPAHGGVRPGSDPWSAGADPGLTPLATSVMRAPAHFGVHLADAIDGSFPREGLDALAAA